jgi:hypothetical protein
MEHTVPCENWVSFSKEYSQKLRVLKVDVGSVCSKLAYSADLKKHTCLSKDNPSRLENGAGSTLLSFQNWLTFERNTSWKLCFSMLRKALFVPNRPIQQVDETHISFERNSFLIEAVASSTIFPCENWVRFSKESSSKTDFSRWMKADIFPNRPLS